jgi:ribonuclease HI
MDETLTLQFDGGSRGNPGPAGIGVVVAAADGTPLVTLGRFIGRATNNVAEYRALITAMQEARKLGAKKVVIRGDSELVIKQMTGVYRVKNPDMKVLYEEAQAILRTFAAAKFTHNLRDKNELADALANKAMDRRADVTEVDRPAATSAPAVPDAPPAIAVGDRFACPRCHLSITVQSPPRSTPSFPKPITCQCGGKLERP